MTFEWLLFLGIVFVIALIIGLLVFAKDTKKPRSRTEMDFFRNIERGLDKLHSLDEYSDSGKIGERLIYLELADIFPENQILRNVYVKKKDNNYTEIDLVLVTAKGIFVVESKNYRGWIFGSENDGNWTQTFKSGKKAHFFNPVIQNKVHINGLKHTLTEFQDIPYFSIITFGNKCELMDVTIESETGVHVIQLHELIRVITNILKDANDVISEESIKNITSLLGTMSRPNEEIVKQHTEHVKDSISIKFIEGLIEIDEIAVTCPKCGVKMKERINSYTGTPFYGCRNYPNCNGTRSITYNN